jgi:formamidopyrimidine-DNA glycosylase
MPELPEVEVIRQGLDPLLTGTRIVAYATSGLSLRLPMPREGIEAHLLGQKVKATGRRGKYLLVWMDSGALLVIHLGMTGRLGLFPHHEPEARHDHLRLGLDNGLELRFNDARRFGSIQVFSPAAIQRQDPFFAMGPEPFSQDFTASYLHQRAGRRTQPIKHFLLDGQTVAGIGNIYVSEILFAARILPETPIAKVSKGQWQKIVIETRRILTRAIACGGSTIADFVNSRGEAGSFQLELAVYGRAGQPCPRCGAGITRLVMAGRSTFYCQACQGGKSRKK